MINSTFLALAMAAALTAATPQQAGPAWDPYDISSTYDVVITTGICYDDRQSGAIITATDGPIDPDYDYISYRDTAAGYGDIVQTVTFLTAGSDDDVIFRDDYIIGHCDPDMVLAFMTARIDQQSAERLTFYSIH